MSSLAGYAEGTDFHGGRNNQRGLRRVSDRKFIMHEATINNGIILEDYLVAVATFQALLIAIALMGTILHLLEVPDHTELAHSCNQMTLLLPMLCDLNNFEPSFSDIYTHIAKLQEYSFYKSQNSCAMHSATQNKQCQEKSDTTFVSAKQ